MAWRAPTVIQRQMPSLTTYVRDEQRLPVLVTTVVDRFHYLRVRDMQVSERHLRTPNPELEGARAKVASARTFGW